MPSSNLTPVTKAANPLKYIQKFPSPMHNLSTKMLLRSFQFDVSIYESGLKSQLIQHWADVYLNQAYCFRFGFEIC